MPEELYLYKLTRADQENAPEYGIYDSCVVAAPDQETAKSIHPSGEDGWDLGSWCERDRVLCTKIGKAYSDIPKGVVIASYNAG